MAEPLQPPWSNDNRPDLWVKLTVAAEQYFKKNPSYLRYLASRGELPGAARYGREWWVRLPEHYSPVSTIIR